MAIRRCADLLVFVLLLSGLARAQEAPDKPAINKATLKQYQEQIRLTPNSAEAHFKLGEAVGRYV